MGAFGHGHHPARNEADRSLTEIDRPRDAPLPLPLREATGGDGRAQASIRHVARAGGALAVCLIVWLSLIPGAMQTRTPLPKQGEHFLAYLLTAACIALALGRRRSRLYAAGALMALAGALEIGQALVPGRTPGLGDFLASCLGSWAGVGLASLTIALLQRFSGTTDRQ